MEPKKYFVLTFNPIRWAEGGWEREDFEEWLHREEYLVQEKLSRKRIRT